MNVFPMQFMRRKTVVDLKSGWTKSFSCIAIYLRKD